MSFQPPKMGLALILLASGMMLGIIIPLIILLGLMAVFGVDYNNYVQFAMLLGEALIPIPMLMWALSHKIKLSEIFRFRSVKLIYIVYALFAGLGLIFVLDEVERLINIFVTPPDFMEGLEKLLQISDLKSAILLIGGVSIIGPLTEEMVFRGFFQQSLEKNLKHITNAVIYTAIAFMISHFNIYWALNIFVIGFFLSFVAWKTNSIWPTFLIHLVNNSMSLAFVHYEEKIDPIISFHGHTHPLFFLIGLFLLVYFIVKLTKLENCT